MNAKLLNTEWIDPDDAPDMSETDFSKGTWFVGGKQVTEAEGKAAMRARGRPVGSVKSDNKVPVKIRLDADLLETLRSSGKGWQTRVNDWLKAHPMPKH